MCMAAIAVVSAAACAAPPSPQRPAPEPSSRGAARPVVRTADPARRGLTAADFPRVQRLADGVYSYEQLRSAGAETFTTVSLFVVTPAGVLVADGQGSEAETRRLVATIAAVTDRPITHVVVCSDHGDHTGGNAAFPANAAYLAHPTSAAVLSAAAARRGGAGGAASGGAGDARRGGGRGAEAAPTVRYTLVADREVIRLGGREIHVRFLGRAHTGGDLVVHLPREKILFMSETFLNRVFPAMRSAFPSEWLAMLDAARSMDIDLYVPGHGFVDSPRVLEQELDEYRNALARVIGEARRLHAAGVGVEDAVGRAEFGDLEEWSLRASQAPIAIRRVYMELNGELR